MNYSALHISLDKDQIATVTIDVPEQSMNVWDSRLICEFSDWVDEFISNTAIRGAIIVSGKSSGFHVGADIDLLLNEPEADDDTLESLIDRLSQSFRKLETGGHPATSLLRGQAYAKPVAVVIDGLALGGGFELALACHYRVMANNHSGGVGLPESQLGLLPGAGGIQRVLRLAGLKVAKDMALNGRTVTAKQALESHLVHEVVEKDAAIEAARHWVRSNPKATQLWDRAGYVIPGGGSAFDPRSVQFFVAENARHQRDSDHRPYLSAILNCLYQGAMLTMDKALANDTKYFKLLMQDSVARNMISTLFVAKKRLDSGIQRPKNIPRQTIKTVGVIGAGLMGGGIALVSALSGMSVLLIDRDRSSAERGKAYIADRLALMVKRGTLTQTDSETILSRVDPTSSFATLGKADLIIEAVYEDPAVKAEVIKQAEAYLRPSAIFASNTSTIPIGQLAAHSNRPENFIGIHFFSPVDRMPLVEIIPGGSSDTALAVALDYTRLIKKTPIIVQDVRGFYTNRIMPIYLAEAMMMVDEGVNPALIENAALQLGMPVGPLALIDETALSLHHQLMVSTRKDLGDDYISLGHEKLLEKMVNQLNRKGRRAGGGFYEYPEEAVKHLWPALSQHFPLMPNQPGFDEVQTRLLYAQLVPAFNCLADGVVKDTASADLGAILGWGFPTWTGGPISHIQTLGPEQFSSEATRLANQYGERFLPRGDVSSVACG